MGERWDRRGLPHKGWSCAGMEDLGSAEGQCEMCGKEEIRYVHFMEHPEIDGTLSVGCICAEKMEGEYGRERTRAKRREARLRNAAGRRQRWPELSGWKRSTKGKDGRRVVIFTNGAKFKFLIEDEGQTEPYFSPRSYADIREAKLAAFDAFTYQQED